MSTTTTTTEPTTTDAPPADEATTTEAPAGEGTDDDGDQGEEGAPRGKAGRQAAAYRTQLRAEEAKTASLTARVDVLQRAEVVRLAGQRLANGQDLLDLHPGGFADLLDADGNVDPERVQAASAGLVEARGRHFGRNRFGGGGDGGGGQAGQAPAAAGTWQTVLRKG